MGEIVNLNRARKSRAKTGQKAEAVANRIAHGRMLGRTHVTPPGSPASRHGLPLASAPDMG